MIKSIQAQLRGSTALADFLRWYLEEEFRKNIYTEGYGAERAFKDGKAKQIEELSSLIEGLIND